MISIQSESESRWLHSTGWSDTITQAHAGRDTESAGYFRTSTDRRGFDHSRDKPPQRGQRRTRTSRLSCVCIVLPPSSGLTDSIRWRDPRSKSRSAELRRAAGPNPRSAQRTAMKRSHTCPHQRVLNQLRSHGWLTTRNIWSHFQSFPIRSVVQSEVLSKSERRASEAWVATAGKRSLRPGVYLHFRTSPHPERLPGKTNGRLHICGPFCSLMSWRAEWTSRNFN